MHGYATALTIGYSAAQLQMTGHNLKRTGMITIGVSKETEQQVTARPSDASASPLPQGPTVCGPCRLVMSNQ
eukprot:scaffold14755_cov157-Amphora_coffeaeformis.AAC.2